MKLPIENLNSHYGPAHILFDVALDVGDGRGGRAVGAQRRRQVHDLSLDRRPRRTALRPHPVRGPRHREPADACDRARRARLCAGRAAHLYRSDGGGKSRGRPPAAAQQCTAMDARAAVRAVSESCRNARPAGRAHERRRAADAHHRAHVDGQSVAGAARRAVRRPLAEDRGADGRGHSDHEKGRRQPLWSPSRICISRG